MVNHAWEPAEGTIIDSRYPGFAAISLNSVRYLVEVRPRSGRPFRAVVEAPSFTLSFKYPVIGQVVRLQFDRDRKKVRFDGRDPSADGISRPRPEQPTWDRLGGKMSDPRRKVVSCGGDRNTAGP